jgi:hypothetical protein
MLDDNYGMYNYPVHSQSVERQAQYQQMSNNVSSEYYITTDTIAVPPNYSGQLTITPALHSHTINPSGGWWCDASGPGVDYQESFGKLITFILGSSKVSQDIKDEFINQGMRLEEFRKYVKEYFPQYIDKIVLWEKLHLNEK